MKNEIDAARARIAELEALVKRHEEALRFISTPEGGKYSAWEDDVNTYVVLEYDVHKSRFGTFKTPLAAIEAAMKEEGE